MLLKMSKLISSTGSLKAVFKQFGDIVNIVAMDSVKCLAQSSLLAGTDMRCGAGDVGKRS